MNKRLTKIITNKYFIVSFIFFLQLSLFENIDLFTLFKMKNQESRLKNEVVIQSQKIEEIKQNSSALHDPKERERFARERYHFKKSNEKIFIISNE